MIRLEDIAREAHVSIATVSRVLNGNQSVGLNLRKCVLDVVSRHNYQLNNKVKLANAGKCRLIGVVVPDISNPIYGNIIKGIDSVVKPLGFSIVVCDYMDDHNALIEIFDVLAARGVDGIVFTSPIISEGIMDCINRKTFPIVSILSEPKGPTHNLNVVNIDNMSAVRSAVRFLHEMGHSRIAFISGTQEDISAGQMRMQGYLAGLQDVGVESVESYIYESDFTVDGGYEAMRILYEENVVLPTCVLAACDNIAVGAIGYLFDIGVDVPGSISVMGMDDSSIATSCRPQLTTIRHCTIEHGVAAANIVISNIMNPDTPRKQMTMPFKIIRRHSVKCYSGN